MESFFKLFVSLCIAFAVGLPTNPTEEPIVEVRKSFASDASQLIATNLLKSFIDIDGNQVHSPLGVASILAVLAEGSAGETFDEYCKVFGYPQERSDQRNSFKRVLSRYQSKEYSTEPSFQTWLYIYRNYSARDEFKRLIHDNYYVEIKDINRDDYDWSEPSTSLDLDGTTISTNSKDVVGFETLKRIKTDEESDATIDSSASKDSYGEEVIQKEASKFDRFVDDKQYVEKPVILEELQREEEKKEEKLQEKKEEKQEEVLKNKLPEKLEEKLAAVQEQPAEVVEIKPKTEKLEISKPEANLDTKEKNKREEDLNVEENETVSEAEKIHKLYSDSSLSAKQEKPVSNEPEKVSIPLQKLESAVDAATKSADEIMIALESHISSVRRVFGARSLFNKDDISSALSANSITGREFGSKTKMLLFNGLYYRGEWAQPFLEYNKNSDEYFHMTAEDAVKTPMMHSKGKFYTTQLDHLNAKYLCLPYKNKKYALTLIVPNEIEGLHSVIEKLQPADFKLAKSQAKSKDLHISIPKFQVEETSRSESMLKSLGLKKMFSREEADLSLLSDDKDLHVDEIVQFVNVRVDEGGVTKNALSASTTQGRTAMKDDLERIEVNRPFLYFIMDCEEDFVIASGKIYSPEYKEEQPISVEIEFEQA